MPCAGSAEDFAARIAALEQQLAELKGPVAEEKAGAQSTRAAMDALPDLLDFVGPVSTIFVRQPQVRWTEGSLQFALENPATRIGDLSWSIAALGRQLGGELIYARKELEDGRSGGLSRLQLAMKYAF